jgi:branched-chain amino acid aminotransferase
MLDERLVWINGKMVKWHDATVHMMSHSFARGSTIFEVISFYRTPAGPAVFRLNDHIARLRRSAELLHMELPAGHDALCAAVAQAVRANLLERGVVKMVGYYPQLALDVQPPQKRLDLAVFALDPAADMGFPDAGLGTGTTAGIAAWRKLDGRTVPVAAKAAANYLNGMIAKLDVQQRGFEEAVMLDAEGFIAEGATESVFMVRDGRVLTPALGTVLDSITRRSILEICRRYGIPCEEGRYTPALLFEAEEIFFGNTPFKVIPVRRIEHRKLTPVPGPMQVHLADILGGITSGANADFSSWMFPVG